MKLVLILGSQLFDPKNFSRLGVDPAHFIVFMREDQELASYFRFHKHKIIFFFAAMRAYRDELLALGFKVHYETFSADSKTYEESLKHCLAKNQIKESYSFEIEDKFFEIRIINLFKKLKIPIQFWPTPMFLTSRNVFKEYLESHRKPLMKTFYEGQRRRLQILVEEGGPVGGKWSFDADNRLALPKDKLLPTHSVPKVTSEVLQVCELTETHFSAHPGDVKNFWLPVDRKGAREWLHFFLKEKLADFGPYEDAIPQRSEFVFHSVLTPFLNCGLLTPSEVVDQTLRYSKKNVIPLPSLEGFLRQIIGWREFIRGIYQNYSEQQESSNFWQSKNKLSRHWYEGGTGVPPLDETITRVLKRGYAHHIERLMVVGSLMVLLEIDPQEAHRWFMEMFVDSSDWVMGPNVYGMALYSDGGIFSTKPYICGSNYLRKMGGYPKSDWCDAVDGLYWNFIVKHEKFFLKNPRLSMIARSAKKIPEKRQIILDRAAASLRLKLVVSK